MSSQINIESVISDPQTNTESIISDSQTNTDKSKRTKTSWIWKHFIEEKIVQNKKEINVIVCQEKIDGTICGTTYVNSGSSTGNAITHLCSRHNITKAGRINKVGLKILFIYSIVI